MQYYRNTSHTKFDLKYHLAWATKYRKPVLTTQYATRIRDLIREVCQANDVIIIRGHVSKDHVHIFISSPPNKSISKIVQLMKGKTSIKMMQEYPAIKKMF